MPIHSALPAVPRAASPLHRGWLAGTCVRIEVDALGYRVPLEFAGHVHSVFAQACNIACGDALLTLVGPDAGRGPTLLCMAEGAPRDLRRLFSVAQPLRCMHGIVRTAAAEIDISRASVWRPAPLRARLPQALVADNLRRAASVLAARRRRCASVIDREAAACAAAVLAACRARDARLAAQQAERLIGWGEGLTPAGDDFVIGVCAGLDAWIDCDAPRACREALGAAMIAAAGRTTAISAHYLRLAAAGHYHERLLAACDALLGEASWPCCARALHALCAVGASSGTDTLAGLLAALTAGPPATEAAP